MNPIQAAYPATRLRRLRQNEGIRGLVRENYLSASDFIWPVFVRSGEGVVEEIPSMPGVVRRSVDKIVEAAIEARDLGIGAICLFPYTGLEERTEDCAGAWDPENHVNRAIRAELATAINPLPERLRAIPMLLRAGVLEQLGAGASHQLSRAARANALALVGGKVLKQYDLVPGLVHMEVSGKVEDAVIALGCALPMTKMKSMPPKPASRLHAMYASVTSRAVGTPE